MLSYDFFSVSGTNGYDYNHSTYKSEQVVFYSEFLILDEGVNKRKICPNLITIVNYNTQNQRTFSYTFYLVYDTSKYSSNSYWLISELPADYTLVNANGFIYWAPYIYSDTGECLCNYYDWEKSGYSMEQIGSPCYRLVYRKDHEVILFCTNTASNATDGYRFTKFFNREHTIGLLKEVVGKDIYEYGYNINYKTGGVTKDKNIYFYNGTTSFTECSKIHKIVDNIDGYAYYYYDEGSNLATYFYYEIGLIGDGDYESMCGKLDTGRYIQIFKIPITELPYIYIVDPNGLSNTKSVGSTNNVLYTYYTNSDYIDLFNGNRSWVGDVRVEFDNSIFENDNLAKLGLVSVDYGDLPIYRDYNSNYDGVTRQILLGKSGTIQYGKISENYDASGRFVNYRLQGDDSIIADGYILDPDLNPYVDKYFKYYKNNDYTQVRWYMYFNDTLELVGSNNEIGEFDITKYDDQGNIEFFDYCTNTCGCDLYDYVTYIYDEINKRGNRYLFPQDMCIIRNYLPDYTRYTFKYGRRYINGASYCCITDLKIWNMEIQQDVPVEVNKNSIYLTSEILQEYINGGNLNLVNEYSYDMNSDLLIDTEDVALHLQYLRDN